MRDVLRFTALILAVYLAGALLYLSYTLEP